MELASSIVTRLWLAKIRNKVQASPLAFASIPSTASGLAAPRHTRGSRRRRGKNFGLARLLSAPYRFVSAGAMKRLLHCMSLFMAHSGADLIRRHVRSRRKQTSQRRMGRPVLVESECDAVAVG
jgi:hypothetical protein